MRGPECATLCPISKDPVYTLQTGDEAWVLSDAKKSAPYTGKKVTVTGHTHDRQQTESHLDRRGQVMEDAALKRTPLHQVHRAAGAKMVDFGGWDMPVQYSGIVEEHNAVRSRVGLFDVSHMGEIEVRGPEAMKLVDHVTTNAVAKLKNGQAHYSGLLYEHGGFRGRHSGAQSSGRLTFSSA